MEHHEECTYTKHILGISSVVQGSQLGWVYFFTPEDIWHCLEIFWLSQLCRLGAATDFY